MFPKSKSVIMPILKQVLLTTLPLKFGKIVLTTLNVMFGLLVAFCMKSLHLNHLSKVFQWRISIRKFLEVTLHRSISNVIVQTFRSLSSHAWKLNPNSVLLSNSFFLISVSFICSVLNREQWSKARKSKINRIYFRQLNSPMAITSEILISVFPKQTMTF